MNGLPQGEDLIKFVLKCSKLFSELDKGVLVFEHLLATEELKHSLVENDEEYEQQKKFFIKFVEWSCKYEASVKEEEINQQSPNQDIKFE